MGGKAGYSESLRKDWDERAERYDEWYKTFRGAVENAVDWELLQCFLPRRRKARILDAAGGTGRITLPLARMGYSVTLCDISSRMLNIAKQKLGKEGVLGNVDVVQGDIRNLMFADESFDFTLCWNGIAETAKELVRVTKKGGRVSFFLMNKCGLAMSLFRQNPEEALALLKSKSPYVCLHGEHHLAVTEEEAKEIFGKEGIKVIDVFAVCGMLDVLSIPEEVQKSCCWDEKFFKGTVEIVLRLSKEPSTKGLSKHLVLYGERV